MIELFFIKIRKLSNLYKDTGDDEYKYKIMNIFVDFFFSGKSLELINYSIEKDYDLYEDFISYFAFRYSYNYRDMRYLTDQELLEIDTFKMFDISNYDEVDLFLFYKNKL